MRFFQFPSEEYFNKMIPLLCRIVGIVVIVSGILELLLIPVLFLGNAEDIVLIVLILLGSAIINAGIGIVVIKYMPKFMFSSFQKIRENPLFKS